MQRLTLSIVLSCLFKPRLCFLVQLRCNRVQPTPLTLWNFHYLYLEELTSIWDTELSPRLNLTDSMISFMPNPHPSPTPPLNPTQIKGMVSLSKTHEVSKRTHNICDDMSMWLYQVYVLSCFTVVEGICSGTSVYKTPAGTSSLH